MRGEKIAATALALSIFALMLNVVKFVLYLIG